MSPPPLTDHPLLPTPAAANSVVRWSPQTVTMEDSINSASSLTNTAGNSSTRPPPLGSAAPDASTPWALTANDRTTQPPSYSLPAVDPSTRSYSRTVPIYEPIGPALPPPSSDVPSSSLASTDRPTISSAPNHFRFLSLPDDVRLRIYTFCLTTDKRGWGIQIAITYLADADELAVSPEDPSLELFHVLESKCLYFAPRLLQVCRSIDTEASEVLYGQNIFYFTGWLRFYCFAKRLRPTTLRQMKSITIDFMDPSENFLGHIRDPEEFDWAKELKELQDRFNWVRVRLIGRGRRVHGRRMPFTDFRNWGSPPEIER